MTDVEVYAKPSIAASVAVFARLPGQLLVVERRRDPYAGFMAFPGGFMDVGVEDLYATAVRELREEAGIDVGTEQLALVDIRSDPARDPREHVVDVGFLCVIDDVVPSLPDTDESPGWLTVAEARSARFAFDHDQMMRAVDRRLRDMGLIADEQGH